MRLWILRLVGFYGDLDFNFCVFLAGYDSVKAEGRRGPDYKDEFYFGNGISIPLGKVIDYQYEQQKQNMMFLNYNEYIVYDSSQVQIRYLLEVSLLCIFNLIFISTLNKSKTNYLNQFSIIEANILFFILTNLYKFYLELCIILNQTMFKKSKILLKIINLTK